MQPLGILVDFDDLDRVESASNMSASNRTPSQVTRELENVAKEFTEKFAGIQQDLVNNEYQCRCLHVALLFYFGKLLLLA